MESRARSFQGVRVAIAGAGQGIGAACARLLAAQGARLGLCARTASDVERLAADLRTGGAGAVAIVADVGTDEGADAFAARSFAALGGVDVGLVCAGAAQVPRPVADVSRALLAEQFHANAVAPALAGAALLRRWKAAPGAGDRQLLFLSSLVTRRPPMAGTAPYTAAKSALEALVRAIAEEGGAVRANALCLGAVATRLHVHAGTPAEWTARFPTADEVAPLVVQMLGPLGRGLTGRVVDAEALAEEPVAALTGAGLLAGVRAVQPLLHAGEAAGEPVPEAEPGRRPSPRVRRAVREAAAALHRYPDAGRKLASRLAALHGGTAVALSGGGASELLERTLRATCIPGDEVVSPFPTFELLSALCQRLGLRHKPVPAPRLADGLFGPHEADGLAGAVGPRTRVVYVASPDNPTGAVLPKDHEAALQRALPPGVALVVDEAWAGAPVPWTPPAEGARVLRLRSFSKLHGLASLRAGYAVGDAQLVELLRRLQLPYPLGGPQLAAIEAALDEPERTRRAAALVARRRARLADELRRMGLSVSGGEAPVLLVREPAGRSAGRLLFALQAAGATVQEAHWDPGAVVLALGSNAEARRTVAAVRRALER